MDTDELKKTYDNDPDVQMAQIGIRLDQYIASGVGAKLVEKAQSQMDEAVVKMLELDPDQNAVEFRKWRSDALVAQQALTWIYNIIEDGRQAEQNIHKQEDYQNN
jgi:hypothetical protein